MSGKRQEGIGLDDAKAAVVDSLVSDLIRERQSERRWKRVKRGMFVAVFGVGMAFYIWGSAKQFGLGLIPGGEKTAIISLDGEIAAGASASAEKLVPLLRKAFEDEAVKSVVLSIDSPGGAPVEAERIYRAVAMFKRENPKPVVAVINNIGASAAYLVALHADKIVAGNYSLVGSIGAILAGWDVHRAMNVLQVEQRVYASGRFKSLLNPFVPMSAEADAKAQEMVDKMGVRFQEELKHARGKKLVAGVDYSTGEVWDGVDAKRLGLVDELGTLDSVVEATGFKGVSYGPRKPGTGWLHSLSSLATWVENMRGLPGF